MLMMLQPKIQYTQILGSGQRGIALIETMVAVVVLALGLLGLGGLQSRSIIWAHSSHFRSIAADLAADLADRIRANRSPFLAVGEDLVTPATGLSVVPNFATCVQSVDKASVTGCPAAFRVSVDMNEWNTNLRNQLPNARFSLVSTISLQGYRYSLTITWLDDRGTGGDSSYVTVIE